MVQKSGIHRVVVRIGFLIVLAMAGLFGISLSATPPNFPAESGGRRFAECPNSPNCVSTQATSSHHLMDPVSWHGTAANAVELIKSTVADRFTRAELVAESPTYLRYEFTSMIFRFVDDVEFLIDEESNLIHFRSASRVGHSDLGANRRRMLRFLSAFGRHSEVKPEESSAESAS